VKNWHGGCNVVGITGTNRKIQGATIMTAIRFAASIVLGLVATTSAFAAEPNEVPTPVATSVAGASAMATTITLAAGPAAVAYKAGPNARYCFVTEQVGSRFRRTQCNTRAGWQAKGINLDRALAGY
jgi:hypothetical protein